VLHYFADVIAGLIAYTYRDKLPSLNLRPDQIKMLKGLPSDRYVELTFRRVRFSGPYEQFPCAISPHAGAERTRAARDSSDREGAWARRMNQRCTRRV
jgi:hypothetical protein